MAEYKYSLLRFYPDAVRDEPINVGVILHSVQNEYLGYRLDLRRVGGKMSRSDKDTFKNFETQFDLIENQEVDWNHARFESFSISDPNFLSSISDAIGNRIRFADPRGLVSEDPDTSLDVLFSRFVSTSGGPVAVRITKGTLVRDIKTAFNNRGVGDYIKSNPVVSGQHRDYKFPLGVRHSHRTFFEALKLRQGAENNYRAMAAVAKLWQDARVLQTNRHSNLCVLLHYAAERLPEGERLLTDDNVQVLHKVPQLVNQIDFDRVQPWA